MSTQTADRVPARGPGPGGPGGFRGGPGAFMAGRSTEKALNFKGSGKRLIKMLAPQRMLVGAALGFGTVGIALNVLGPRILGHATDLIFAGATGGRLPVGLTKAQVVEQLRASGQTRRAELLESLNFVPGTGIDFGAVGRVLLLVALIYLAASAFSWLQARLTTVAVQSAMRELRAQTQSKLSRLPLSYFDGRPRGEILSRVTNDIDNLAQTLQQTMSQMVTSLLTIVGVLVMMILISPLLAVVALVTVPLSILVVTFLGKRAQPQFIRQWSATGRLNGHIEESYTGHALVTVFGRRQESQEAFEEHNGALYDAAFRAQFVSGLIQPAMTLIGNLNYVLVAVVGGLRVTSGSLSLGSVQAFIQYSRQFSQPLTQVAGMANLLQSGIASAERVFALLDAPEQSPEPATSAALPDRTTGRVEFEHVSFRYTPDTPLIEDLSLHVEPGQTVAIVGPTGAGKTTLVNLLMRFYEVTGGRIMLDGVDIAAMDRERLRANTGMVLQDAWLFGGTIADNIAYGATAATREQIVAAAQATHVDALVRTLPEGYDTVLEDDGENVSAGQRQLITIARAFLAEPAILILDEATSSVDTRTEVLIQRAMNLLRQGRTSFVIAHRLSTIRDADVILVMDGGAIVEQGTHTGLLAAGGPYATLYQAQFARGSDEG